MSRRLLPHLVFALSVTLSAFGGNSVVRSVEIQSAWGGLGKPSKTKLLINSENGKYLLGTTRIDPATVELLGASVRQPVKANPSLENLGIDKEWLKNAALKFERLAEQDKRGDDSAYYRLGHGSPNQKAIFHRSYTDPNFVAHVLPRLFSCCHTDDYPSVKVTILYADGKRITVSSHSQSEFMLPWNIEADGASVETFDKKISIAIAALMPKNATNRERISGGDFDHALGWVVMDAIEDDWNLSNVKEHASDALAKIGRSYEVLNADINPYHDVTFGVYVANGKGDGEENLQLTLKRQDFPKGFAVRAILLYKDEKVSGVEQFLQHDSRYETLALSVPWLSKYQEKYPQSGTTLLWVHDRSFTDKALNNFIADMHAVGKDKLANEVRQVQPQVAVLNVSYGDWWLVLPDRRMVLWRYESVMGLLGRKKSEFTEHECTDYRGVTGGCVGAVYSPAGELIN